MFIRKIYEIASEYIRVFKQHLVVVIKRCFQGLYTPSSTPHTPPNTPVVRQLTHFFYKHYLSIPALIALFTLFHWKLFKKFAFD